MTENSTLDASFENITIHIIDGPGKGTSTDLVAGQNIVGRAPEARIRIDQSEISRHHTSITVGEEITIEDMGSALGTILNGRLLVASDFLFDNDEIKVGPCMLRMEIKRRESRKGLIIAGACLGISLIIFLVAMFFPQGTVGQQLASQAVAREKASRTTNWRNWETNILPSAKELEKARIAISAKSASDEFETGTRLYQDRLGNLGNAYQALLYYKRTLAILSMLKPVEARPTVARRCLARIVTLRKMIRNECQKRVFAFQRFYELKWWRECNRVLAEAQSIVPWTGCRFNSWAVSQRRSLVKLRGK